MASSVLPADEEVPSPAIYTCLEAYYVPSMDSRVLVSLEMEEFVIQKAMTPYGTIEDTRRRLLGQVQLAFDWDPTEKRVSTLISDLQTKVPLGVAQGFSAMEISPSSSSKGLEEQIAAYVFFTVRAHFKSTCGIHGFYFGVRCEQKRVVTVDVGRDELARVLQGLGVYDINNISAPPRRAAQKAEEEDPDQLEERRDCCPICLNELSFPITFTSTTEEEEEDVSRTCCGHVFHTGCILRWLVNNLSCPMCRSPLMN